MTVEQWRNVPGYDGVYQVSNRGKVRRAIAGYQGRARARELSAPINSAGYAVVALFKNGRSQMFGVHRLVAEAFVPNEPGDQSVVCHNNGDPTDNRAENLRWGSQSENIKDSVKHGTHRNTRKTECLRGHPLSGGNLYQRPSGRRECRTCIKARQSARRGQSLTVL